MTAPLLAYAVNEEDENTGAIIFARSRIAAHREGANEYGDSELRAVTCRRAAWADKYAPGPAPFKAMFYEGWCQECHGCGRMIREGETDARDRLIRFNIVENAGGIFCTPTCEKRHKARERKKARIGGAAIGALSDEMLRLMPGAMIASTSVHVTQRRDEARELAAKQVIVKFWFPGCRLGAATYSVDNFDLPPRLGVRCGDMIAFARWRSAGYPPAMMDMSEAGP